MARQVRCTECSRIVDPVVSVDIDGVLGNYHEHFTKFASDYLGRQLPDQYSGSEEFSEYLGLPKQLYREIKLAYRQGGQKRMLPLYHGATTFMYDLRYEVGVEVWIATTRPYMRLDNIDPDTRAWLDRHKIHYDHIIYGDDKDDKYEQLVTQVDRERIIGVIDDLYEQCMKAMKHLDQQKVFQPSRLHNKGKPWPNTFGWFHDVQATLLVKADEWRETHNGG